MVNKSYKADLYIILATLLIALIIIGFFWFLNKDKGVSSISDSAPVSTPTSSGLMRISEGGDVNLLVLGDSLVSSTDASNPGQTGWTSLVSHDLQLLYPGTLKWMFTGEGYSADNILPLVPEIEVNSDVVFLCFGRSDASEINPTEFKQKYQQLILDVRKKVPQADLYLIVEPPVKNIQKNNQFFPLRQVILDLGRQNQLNVLDQWTTFINAPEPLDELLAADTINLSDRGYRIFADTVLACFKDDLADH
ncbi:hypothetical protein JT05_09345 [Desulfosporosinus sp. Tol-M]|nr:hypothetical protein JT05_09345 [Desulfosporosinus sp. Tol-M]